MFSCVPSCACVCQVGNHAITSNNSVFSCRIVLIKKRLSDSCHHHAKQARAESYRSERMNVFTNTWTAHVCAHVQRAIDSLAQNECAVGEDDEVFVWCAAASAMNIFMRVNMDAAFSRATSTTKPETRRDVDEMWTRSQDWAAMALDHGLQMAGLIESEPPGSAREL